MSDPLQIHDGRRLRPLTVAQDLRYDVTELIGHPSGASVLYGAERDLLERAALALRQPARRAFQGPELTLGRYDVIVLAHALENLSRMRRRRLESLERELRRADAGEVIHADEERGASA